MTSRARVFCLANTNTAALPLNLPLDDHAEHAVLAAVSIPTER